MLFLLFFFFSSRRRHTRSLRDWSSDVCSSDLLRGARDLRLPGAHHCYCCGVGRSEEHTSELQSRRDLVCRLLLEKKKKIQEKASPKHKQNLLCAPKKTIAGKMIIVAMRSKRTR